MSSQLPSLRPTEVIRALQHAGFYVHHVTGSHHYLRSDTRPTERRYVGVARHNKPMKKGTLVGIIKQAGMSVDEFIMYL